MRAAARSIGISETPYRLWEFGVGMPRFDNLRAIADYCEVPIGVILQDVGVLNDAEAGALLELAAVADAKHSRSNYATTHGARKQRKPAPRKTGSTCSTQTAADQRELALTGS